MNKPQIISENLQKLGVPCHFAGFAYLKDAILMVIDDKTYLVRGITTRLYPYIAKVYGTTDSKVERAIRNAIEVAWEFADLKLLREIMGPVPEKSLRLPMTNSEFIATMAERISLGLLDAAS